MNELWSVAKLTVGLVWLLLVLAMIFRGGWKSPLSKRSLSNRILVFIGGICCIGAGAASTLGFIVVVSPHYTGTRDGVFGFIAGSIFGSSLLIIGVGIYCLGRALTTHPPVEIPNSSSKNI